MQRKVEIAFSLGKGYQIPRSRCSGKLGMAEVWRRVCLAGQPSGRNNQHPTHVSKQLPAEASRPSEAGVKL